MPKWRIYYENETCIRGTKQAEYLAAPDNGVQVIVLMEPPASDNRRWFCAGLGAIEDRQLWTGEDFYDPFGWGKKEGSLIPGATYHRIWKRACGDK